MKKPKTRSPNQTATAISMTRELFWAMEKARAKLQMDRSNFVRYCIAKELASMGIQVESADYHPRQVAEEPPPYTGRLKSGTTRRETQG